MNRRQFLAQLGVGGIALSVSGGEGDRRPAQVAQAPIEVRPTRPPARPPQVQQGQPRREIRQYTQQADVYALAYRHAVRFPPEIACRLRFVWVWDREPLLKWTRWAAVSGHVNGLSLGQRIVSPGLILDDGSGRDWRQMGRDDWARLTLMVLDLEDYRQTAEQWDRLGDPTLEPLFHTFQEVSYPAGMYDGQYYTAGKTRKTVTAPWLYDPLGMPEPISEHDAHVREKYQQTFAEAVDGLQRLTHARTPVVEARNFIWQTAIDANRRAGYYSWLGIKDKKTFDKLVRADFTSTALVEAVSDSGVSQESRQIERYGRGDGYWQTKDQAGHFAQGKRNPLDPKGKNGLEFDAFEVFGHLDNGWWATGLFKKDGSLQQSAPDTIGFNHKTLSNDGRIHVYASCFQCHDAVPGNGGLQPFVPFFRTKYSEPGPLGAVFASKEFEFQYLTPIAPWADLDRRAYYNAVAQANGLEPHQWAAALYDTFHAWDRPVGLETAAAELGVTEEGFVGRLQEYITTWGSLPDPINDNWLKPKEQRPLIGRNAWTEAYPFAQLVLRNEPLDYVWPLHGNKKK